VERALQAAEVLITEWRTDGSKGSVDIIPELRRRLSVDVPEVLEERLTFAEWEARHLAANRAEVAAAPLRTMDWAKGAPFGWTPEEWRQHHKDLAAQAGVPLSEAERAELDRQAEAKKIADAAVEEHRRSLAEEADLEARHRSTL